MDGRGFPIGLCSPELIVVLARQLFGGLSEPFGPGDRFAPASLRPALRRYHSALMEPLRGLLEQVDDTRRSGAVSTVEFELGLRL